MICDEVSDRKELSGRKVCTKLVIYIVSSHDLIERRKVVIHFYHTSNTLQAQGKNVMDSNISAPEWPIEHFIKPLLVIHMEENKTSISKVNSTIQHSTYNCGSCNIALNPSASTAKDQGLLCNKCGRMFYKKCTDRRKWTNNWRKIPWTCSLCETVTNAGGISVLPQSEQTDPLQYEFNSQMASSSLSQPHDTISPIDPIPTDEAARIANRPSDTADLMNDIPVHIPIDYLEAPASVKEANSFTFESHSIQPRVHVNAKRQRSSNVPLHNAELEFHKTALASCRSTISQQEAELKRLKETLEIRTKRIIQLEQIVGYASDHISSRGTQNSHDSNYDVIANRLDEVIKKIAQLNNRDSYPSNNFVINACQATYQSQRTESSTQTQQQGQPISDSAAFPMPDDQTYTEENEQANI